MQSPFISIIIPAFNCTDRIARCMESVIGQTFSDWELIVQDGNSSDDTVSHVQNFMKKYSQITVVSQKDDGIYDAINKGIKISKGRWIYILGSDDALYENTTLEKAAQKLKLVNGGVVYGNVKIKGDAGWAKDGDIHDGEFTLEKLLSKNICQQAVFYHKTIFDKVGYFNPAYKVCADWDFILCCWSKVQMTYCEIIIAEFSGGGTSKTNNEIKFYEDFSRNMYSYFGLRILGKDFKNVTWRFKKSLGNGMAKNNLLMRWILKWAVSRR